MFLALSVVNNKIQEFSLSEKLTVWRHIGGARNFYLSVLFLTITIRQSQSEKLICYWQNWFLQIRTNDYKWQLLRGFGWYGINKLDERCTSPIGTCRCSLSLSLSLSLRLSLSLSLSLSLPLSLSLSLCLCLCLCLSVSLSVSLDKIRDHSELQYNDYTQVSQILSCQTRSTLLLPGKRRERWPEASGPTFSYQQSPTHLLVSGPLCCSALHTYIRLLDSLKAFTMEFIYTYIYKHKHKRKYKRKSLQICYQNIFN